MALESGSRLGPYEIVSPIGAGGMGQVYKARDTRLDRTVALKVLSPHLSASPDARQRFEREARTISQLSHTHICALYDVGREGSVDFLVMELLQGESLAGRLARGPLPLEQTLRCGMEIADALARAHRQGVVHRDLKPANVMLTSSGVKLLDFGLAKVMAPASSEGILTAMPTRQGITQEGTILGTIQYMAPEQLEGKEADPRTDIFAFGALLYEMATGSKAFTGSSHASLISAIMTKEPQPITALQPASPAVLDRLIRTCLAKDPDERWQSAADIRRELRWVAEAPLASPAASASAPRPRIAWLPWAIAAVAVVAALGLALRPRPAPAPAQGRMEFSIVPPDRTAQNDFFALSPDGKTMAFAGIAGGKSLVRLRDLAAQEVRALPGTDSPEGVFWSPDSRSLGFVSRGKLRRIDLATGAIESLADAESGRGATWSEQGDILFAQKAAGAIYKVSASGGPVTPATTMQPGDTLHRWPQFLPDGRRFLYYARTQDLDSTGTYLATVGSPDRKLILRNGATGVFVPPDTLLYCRSQALLAQTINLDTGQLSGEPRTIAHPVMRAELGSFIDLFSVAASGILVFRSGTAESQLTWIDRSGNVLGKIGPPGVLWSVTISPDGRQAATSVRPVESGLFSSSILDLDRGVSNPFMDSTAMPIWTPDGRSLIYRFEGQSYQIRRRAVGRDGPDEDLGIEGPFTTPHTISADGRYLLFTKMGGNFDIGMKDLRGGVEMLLKSEFDERTPSLAPDGRWFAYSSDEPGQTEIYVRRFPITAEKWRVSIAGGQQPLWSRDGKELYFVALDGHLMAAPVQPSGGEPGIGTPQALFPTTVRLNTVTRRYTTSADGQRFLMIVPTVPVEQDYFRVVLNWREGN